MNTHQPTHKAWEEKLDAILDLAGFQIYPHEASINRDKAKQAINALLLETKIEEHWYNANSGRGDLYKYHCKCGEFWNEKAKLDSHIAWKLAALQTITGKPNPQ